jgi:hypothetical protein
MVREGSGRSDNKSSSPMTAMVIRQREGAGATPAGERARSGELPPVRLAAADHVSRAVNEIGEADIGLAVSLGV